MESKNVKQECKWNHKPYMMEGSHVEILNNPKPLTLDIWQKKTLNNRKLKTLVSLGEPKAQTIDI